MAPNSEADKDHWKRLLDEKASDVPWDTDFLDKFCGSGYTASLSPSEECPHCGEYKFEGKIPLSKESESNGFLRKSKSYWEVERGYWECSNCRNRIKFPDFSPSNFPDKDDQ